MTAPLTIGDIVLRTLAAAVAGGLVGLERESHGRAAGLRTTMLTCVASAIAMLISQWLFVESAGGNWRPDPARLGAGILTGIGFLGAGTILRHEDMIRGVTTAASLWFVTVLGLAFGSGRFDLGLIGLGAGLAILLIVPPFEKHIRSDWYSKLSVTLELDSLSESQLEARLQALGLKVRRMDLSYDLTARRKTIACDLRLERHTAIEISAKTVADLRQCPGVLRIDWT